jgi:hypothetical protein
VEGAVTDAARVAAVVVTVAVGTGAESAVADVAAGREAVSLSSGATDDSGSSDDSGKSESFEVHCFEVVCLVCTYCRLFGAFCKPALCQFVNWTQTRIRRVRASLVAVLGVQRAFLVVTLRVGRVGAVKVVLVMLVSLFGILII